MLFVLGAEECAALTTAQQQSRSVRHSRLFQAVLRRADGVPGQ